MAIVRINLEWRPLENSDIAGHLALVAREEGQSNEDGFVIDGNPSLFDTQGMWNILTGYVERHEIYNAGTLKMIGFIWSALPFFVISAMAGVMGYFRHQKDVRTTEAPYETW